MQTFTYVSYAVIFFIGVGTDLIYVLISKWEVA